MLFDVAIPVHKKDLRTLEYCISGIKKNIVGVRNIYLISKESYSDKAIWIDESEFPFSYQEISNLVQKRSVGWCYQQLLKLYSPLVIKGSLPNILIIDSDTIFYKKTTFFDKDQPLYNLSKDLNLYNSQFQIQSCNHIASLIPDIKKKFPELYNNNKKDYLKTCEDFLKKLNFFSQSDAILAKNLKSAVCHHMMFQKEVINSLFNYIEAKNNGEKFYKVFLNSFANFEFISEYNLYFYYLALFFPNSFKIRILNYKNSALLNPLFESMRQKYHYCSYHSYMAKENILINFLNKIYKK